MRPEVKAFYHEPTYTVTYLVHDPATRDAVLIDPVLDFDTLAWRTSTDAADGVAAYVEEHDIHVHWILETHAHADHLSGMEVLKARLGAKTAIGQRIDVVQETFRKAFGLPETFPTDGRQFDRLLADGDRLAAGSLLVEVLHTPGHTPACASYKIGDAVFTGDTLFMPDYGTGRCDFPNGSAADLYESVTTKLYALPADTRVFVGHDYQPGGRDVAWETTIGESKERNIQLRATTRQEEYVAFRDKRDATLSPPRLILQSLQVNIDAGRLPDPAENGIRYFRMPINFLGGKR